MQGKVILVFEEIYDVLMDIEQKGESKGGTISGQNQIEVKIFNEIWAFARF